MNYRTKRLNQIGITEKNNSVKATDLEKIERIYSFFNSDSNDNIRINYISPDGYIEYYKKGNKFFEYSRIRYKEPKDTKIKYYQPKGSLVIPFSTPKIIEAFKTKKKVKTLYITEGEFKAFALDIHDLICFGLPGIHNFKDKSKDKLHHYITDFIKSCNVENIVLLFDADCLEIKWEENKDLAIRLNSFYTAVNTFNELLKPYDTCLYFAHIFKGSNYKGIDDLLSANKNKTAIIDELKSLLNNLSHRKYIMTHKISAVSPYNIKKIFYLDNVKTFYQENSDTLKDKEFVYKNETYFEDEKGILQISWKGQQNNYLRVGCDFFKLITEVSPNNQNENNLKKWTISNIKSDYNFSKEFIKQIPKYDDFTNIPENNPDKFQKTIFAEKNGIKSKLYNRYCPVSHIPKKGTWLNINKLLHHIFDYKNTSGQSMYEFILDYLQILYLKPETKLPVLCLVSKENSTGKTTFLDFCQSIFQENMKILDSDRFSSNFNGIWAGKLIVAIDESRIPVEKEIIKNRIKMIVTNKSIPLEEKGVESRVISNYSKLILCSNDETNFMKIDHEENRYCVIKVPTIPKECRDNKLNDKIIQEIPAFLHFLKNRELFYPEKSRLYFDEDVYTTPALLKVKERTESPLSKHIKLVIKEQFLYSQQDSIKLSLKAIVELLNKQYKYADKIKIKEYLNDNGYTTGNSTNFTYYIEEDDYYIQKKGKCYTFHAKNFLNEEELLEISNSETN